MWPCAFTVTCGTFLNYVWATAGHHQVSAVSVSDFCLYEPKDWVQLPSTMGNKTLVKHSPWMVLSRNDVAELSPAIDFVSEEFVRTSDRM